MNLDLIKFEELAEKARLHADVHSSCQAAYAQARKELEEAFKLKTQSADVLKKYVEECAGIRIGI